MKHEKTRPFSRSKPCLSVFPYSILYVIVHIPLTHAIIFRMAGNIYFTFCNFIYYHIQNFMSIKQLEILRVSLKDIL